MVFFCRNFNLILFFSLRQLENGKNKIKVKHFDDQLNIIWLISPLYELKQRSTLQKNVS